MPERESDFAAANVGECAACGRVERVYEADGGNVCIRCFHRARGL